MLNNKENAISKIEPMGKSTEQRSSSKKVRGGQRERNKEGRKERLNCMYERGEPIKQI